MFGALFSIALFAILSTQDAFCQRTDEQMDSLRQERIELDSIYLAEVEQQDEGPYKVLHAEPLYIDLIRDLGARKGEKEWNFGMGITDKRRYDEYEFLVEYEFAPIDRLGLEVEIPFSVVAPRLGDTPVDAPASRMESIKLAAQYTFLVSKKAQASFALGYINEFIFSDFRNFGKPVFTGNLFNPFLIAAKRIGRNFHTLVYTGPHIEMPFDGSKAHFQYEIHSNFHYMIRGTRNFIGLEVNKYIDNGKLDMTIRPQMRVGIADNFLVGIVTGIPVGSPTTGFSMFTRVIWEPGHKKGH
jgi:hypothetical protein